MPMMVANTYVSNAIKIAQETIIWNHTNKLTMKEDHIYVTNVIRNLHIQIV